MAIAHLYFSAQSEYGRKLRHALDVFEQGLDELNALSASMTMMVDGDGSNATMFDEVALRFSFADNATAKAAWDELNSCLAKFNTDAQVSSVHAATVQLINKLR